MTKEEVEIELLTYRLKREKFDYLVSHLQFLVATKKDFQLQTAVETELMNLAKAELPAGGAITLP